MVMLVPGHGRRGRRPSRVFPRDGRQRGRVRLAKLLAIPLNTTMSTNFDRRRINGPEESFSPVYASDEEDERATKPGQPSRKGRQASEIRPICTVCAISSPVMPLNCSSVLKTGLISQANGSSYIETEKTKIACAMCVRRPFRSKGRDTDMHIDMVLGNPRLQRSTRRGD